MKERIPLAHSTIILLLILGVACSMLNNKPKSGREKIYRIKTKVAGFKKVENPEADYAFEDGHGSYIVAYSICEREEPGDLKRKAERLLNAFPDRKIISERKSKLGKHSAYEMKAKGFKDNKEFRMDLLVSEIENCSVDYYYLAALDKYENKKFEEFLSHVKLVL